MSKIILTKKMMPSLVTMFRSEVKADVQLAISIIQNINRKQKHSKLNYDQLIIDLCNYENIHPIPKDAYLSLYGWPANKWENNHKRLHIKDFEEHLNEIKVNLQ